MQRFYNFLMHFRHCENGNATVEFAIVFPAMIAMLLAGAELGMVSLRHSMLERAMELTVRDIRLGTGDAPQHDQIKTAICGRATFIENCSSNLRLEMVRVDPRNWKGINNNPDCTDKSENAKPVRNFNNQAQANDMMILRACAKITPIFPTTGLGKSVIKDAAGQFALVSMSAFVQEPE